MPLISRRVDLVFYVPAMFFVAFAAAIARYAFQVHPLVYLGVAILLIWAICLPYALYRKEKRPFAILGAVSLGWCVMILVEQIAHYCKHH
jgi:hypothetical protein